MQFKDRLKKILTELNISQSDLAKGSGLSRSAITHYINGTNSPTMKNIEKISNFLNIKIESLLYDEETSTHKNIDFLEDNKTNNNQYNNKDIHFLSENNKEYDYQYSYNNYKNIIFQERYENQYQLFQKKLEETLERLILYTLNNKMKWKLIEYNDLFSINFSNNKEKLRKYYYSEYNEIEYYLDLNLFGSTTGLYASYKNSFNENPKLLVDYKLLPKELDKLNSVIFNKKNEANSNQLDILNLITESLKNKEE